jgi:uncharacterized delta-60 repeat protein
MRNAMKGRLWTSNIEQTTSVVFRRKSSIIKYAVQILVVALLFIEICSAQEKFAWSVSGMDNDGGYSVIQTTDGGYFIAGYTHSFGAVDSDLLLVKLNSTGFLEWAETVSGTDYDCGCSIVGETDGGYAVAGYTNSYGAGSFDLFLIKFDYTGSLEWAKAVGETGYDCGRSVVRTTDSGYVVTGYTNSFGAGNHDLFLVKFSSSGTVDWAKTVGGTDFDFGHSVDQTTDGGYVVAGYTNTYGTGNYDLFLVKFDFTGSLEWVKTVGGTGIDFGRSVVQTTDSGYAVAGMTTSFGAGYYDLFFVKLSSTGSVQWARAVGGMDNDEGYSVVQTSDRGYVVAGYTNSFGAGYSDLFLVKFNSSGSLDWAKVFGGTIIDQGYSVIQTTDGGYAVTGHTASFGAGDNDLFLVKFDTDGNTCIGEYVSPTVTDVSPSVVSVSIPFLSISEVAPTITDVAPTVTDICTDISEVLTKPNSFGLTVSPNPFNLSCAIMICQHGASAPCVKVKVEIYDLQGKLVWNKPSDSDNIGVTSLIKGGKTDEVPINKGDVAKRQGFSASAQGVIIWQPGESISSGVYLVRATTTDGQQITKRIVYLK